MSARTRGIIVGVETDKLIVEASDREVRRYGRGDQVELERQATLSQQRRERGVTGIPRGQADLTKLMEHGLLYDQHGKVVCAILSLTTETEAIDATVFGDLNRRRYLPGLVSYSIQARGHI